MHLRPSDRPRGRSRRLLGLVGRGGGRAVVGGKARIYCIFCDLHYWSALRRASESAAPRRIGRSRAPRRWTLPARVLQLAKRRDSITTRYHSSCSHLYFATSPHSRHSLCSAPLRLLLRQKQRNLRPRQRQTSPTPPFPLALHSSLPDSYPPTPSHA